MVNKFDKRWLGLPLAAAGVAVAGSADRSDAAIVAFAPAGGVSWPNSITGAFVNVENGASGTTYAAVNGGNLTAPAFNFWGTSANRTWMYPTASTTNALVGTAGNVTVKTPGQTVGAADAFIPSATGGSPMSPTGTTWNSTAGFEGYFGFRFLNTAGTQTNFGWAHVRYNAWPGATNAGGTLLDWAYDNTGATIVVGDTGVPEPTSIGLLAAGAVGLIARRRRA